MRHWIGLINPLLFAFFCIPVFVFSKELTIKPDFEYLADSEGSAVLLCIEDARNKIDRWKLKVPIDELSADTDNPVLWLDREQIEIHSEAATGAQLSGQDIRSILQFLETGFSRSAVSSNTTIGFIDGYLTGKRLIVEQFHQPYSLRLNRFNMTAEGAILLEFRDNHGNDYAYYLETESGSFRRIRHRLPLKREKNTPHPVSHFWKLLMTECAGNDIWSCLHRQQHKRYDVDGHRLFTRQTEQQLQGISTAGTSNSTSPGWQISDRMAITILGIIGVASLSVATVICAAIAWCCMYSEVSVTESAPSLAAGANPPPLHRHDSDARPVKPILKPRQGIMVEPGTGSMGATRTAPYVKGKTLYPVKSSPRLSAKSVSFLPCTTDVDSSNDGLELENKSAAPPEVRINDEPIESEESGV